MSGDTVGGGSSGSGSEVGVAVAGACVACVLVMLAVTRAIACPTCVGRITDQSAPFFSDEAYRHDAEPIQNDVEEQEEGLRTDDRGEGLLW